MPADDLVINVRQIEGYASASSALPDDALLIQRGGLGGPYLSLDAQLLVGTALAQGGDMAIAGRLTAQAFSGGLAQFSNAAVSVFVAQKASFSQATLGGCTIATLADVAGTVTSFNARTGDVCFALQDLLDAGGAPIFSPVFGGEPRAPTPASWSNSSRLATTGFVHRGIVEYIEHLLVDHPFVFTFNGRSGDVVLTAQDIVDAGGGEIFDSPVFTGIPVAPTAPVGTNTTQLATCAFVIAQIADALATFGSTFAPIDSPQFTGFPSGPTAPLGSSTGQLATTAFVQDAVTAGTAGVASFNTRTGAVVLTSGDITGAGGALTVSPAFTGTPTAPTAPPGTNSTVLATTAYVLAAVGGIGVDSFNGRSGVVVLTTADITGAGGAPIANAALTGVPTGPTAAPATSTGQLATTAFVMNALSAGGVTSFNTRTGAITLLASDISAAGGATLVSPIFTGVPQAPTASPGTSTAQLATCAFVAAAINGAVSSFNGRTGAITLTSADISAAGGAALASPHFTGVPTAPTPATSDNSTALATTAYVNAAIAAGSGVSTFNGRAGAVTLTGADVSAAGGALTASPTFTGIPAGPTAAANTNTTQLATTAFVMNALSAGGGVQSFNGRAGTVTLTTADVAAATLMPTTRMITATSTYTPTAGVKYIRVRMVGGGGGGGGAGGGAAGGNGGNTSLASWTALGGTGGQPGGASSTGGAGGAGGGPGSSGTGNQILRLSGSTGGSGQSMATIGAIGGSGGSTPFGSGPTVRFPAATPTIPTGAGGPGAFSTNATVGGAGGGGGGEYVEFYLASPVAGTATIGAGGAFGTNGGSGVNGAPGEPGLIVIEEFYS